MNEKISKPVPIAPIQSTRHDSFKNGASRNDNAAEQASLVVWMLDILKRQFMVAVTVFISIIVVAILLTALLERLYSATALVVFDATEAQLLGLTDANSPSGSVLGVIETEVEIARSTDVLNAVIDKLDLANDDEFRYRPSSVNQALGFIGLSPVVEPLARDEDSDLRREAERTAVVQNLAKALNVRRQGITNIISISAESRSPEKAARIANQVAADYIAFQARNKATTASNAARLLSARVEAMSSSIREVEDQLDLFIASAAERYGSGDVAARVRQLKGELEKQASQSERRRADANALSSFRQNGQIAAGLSNPQIADMLATRQDLLGSLAALQQGDREQQNSIRKRLEELDQRLSTATEDYSRQLGQQEEAAAQRERDLRAQLQASLADITIPNEGMVEFYTLQQEAKSGRDLYDATLSRLRQLELQANFAIADSRLVSRAMLPERISFPPVKIMLGLAFVLALAGAAGAAVVREQYIGGFMTSDQIEAMTGRSVLATIPKYRPPSNDMPNALLEAPLSHYSEALRRAKLNIEVSLDFPEKLRVMLTSTTTGEGKSTLSLALAETFAEAGRKTILIDADLRRPSIAAMVGIDVRAGLFDVLSRNDVSLEHAIVRDMRQPHGNLAFLPGSPNPGLPTDRLVASDRFSELLDTLQGYFDVIIIDTPPIGHVVDAQIIAHKVDLGLYVVHWGQTSQIEVRTGIRELEKAKACALSIVMNQSRERSTTYGTPSGYGYYSRG